MIIENKDTFKKNHQQHKKLGISKKIDYENSYIDSLVINSVALVDPYPDSIDEEIAGKCTIGPSMVDRMTDIMDYIADKDQITTNEVVNHFGFTPNIAKQCLSQLMELGYLEAHGAKNNRTYKKHNKQGD